MHYGNLGNYAVYADQIFNSCRTMCTGPLGGRLNCMERPNIQGSLSPSTRDTCNRFLAAIQQYGSMLHTTYIRNVAMNIQMHGILQPVISHVWDFFGARARYGQSARSLKDLWHNAHIRPQCNPLLLTLM